MSMLIAFNGAICVLRYEPIQRADVCRYKDQKQGEASRGSFVSRR